jgi:hypothetical protein
MAAEAPLILPCTSCGRTAARLVFPVSAESRAALAGALNSAIPFAGRIIGQMLARVESFEMTDADGAELGLMLARIPGVVIRCTDCDEIARYQLAEGLPLTPNRFPAPALLAGGAPSTLPADAKPE